MRVGGRGPQAGGVAAVDVRLPSTCTSPRLWHPARSYSTVPAPPSFQYPALRPLNLPSPTSTTTLSRASSSAKSATRSAATRASPARSPATTAQTVCSRSRAPAYEGRRTGACRSRRDQGVGELMLFAGQVREELLPVPAVLPHPLSGSVRS